MGKWIKVVIALVIAIGLIGTGVYMKLESGYTLDTDENIKEAIQEVFHVNVDDEEISYSAAIDSDKSLYFVITFYKNTYKLFTFEQNSKGKYESDFHYVSFPDSSENAYVISLSPMDNIVCIPNVFGMINSIDITAGNYEIGGEVVSNQKFIIEYLGENQNVQIEAYDSFGDHVDLNTELINIVYNYTTQ